MQNLDSWTSWLLSKWKGRFEHSYSISKSRHWKWYRQTHDLNTWRCDNLAEAAERYCWNGGDYDENEHNLTKISHQLLTAIDRHDDSQVHTLCLEIGGWGAVARSQNHPTRRWLAQKLAEKSLGQSISAAVSALRDHAQLVTLSRNLTFPMDSTSTKIFSLADPSHELIIYDGRVGAALGLLARRFAEQSQMTALEPELVYGWGREQTGNYVSGKLSKRNPSAGPFQFKEFAKQEVRAEQTSRSSRLLNTLAKASKVSARRWEAALFMIGYSVRG